MATDDIPVEEEPKEIVRKWARMIHKMADNVMVLVEVDAEYHFCVQVGLIVENCMAILTGMPMDGETLGEAAKALFQTGIQYQQDTADVSYIAEDGVLSMMVIIGGNLGRDLADKPD